MFNKIKLNFTHDNNKIIISCYINDNRLTVAFDTSSITKQHIELINPLFFTNQVVFQCIDQILKQILNEEEFYNLYRQDDRIKIYKQYFDEVSLSNLFDYIHNIIKRKVIE